MIMVLFPLGVSGGISCCLLPGEHHSWKEMPAYSGEEREAGRGGSWWNKESWKDHSKWTSGCVQIAKLISLQGTKQVKYLPGIWLFKITAVCASPPFLLGAQLGLQAKEKSVPKGKKKEGVEAEDQLVFQPRYCGSGD